jgi:hypothetical protein
MLLDFKGNVVRLAAKDLGKRHGTIGLVIAMARILDRLDKLDIGRGIGYELCDGMAKDLL